MKFSAILLITTVLSGVYSDEVTTKDSLETVAPTELIVPDIFEVVDIVNDLDTIAPSKFVTDDDWDPAFLLDEELTMQRLLQVNETNETLTNTVYFQADICSTDCPNTAENAVTPATTEAMDMFLETAVYDMTGIEVGIESLTATQGACGACSADRFLQKMGRSLQDDAQSTTVTFAFVFDVGVDVDVVRGVLASPDFGSVSEAVELATGGVLSNLVVSATAPTTDSPTVAPESQAPSESPTDAPIDPPTEAPIEPTTDAPSDFPTPAPSESPTDAPIDLPIDAPIEPPTETPIEPTTDAPSDFPTPAPSDFPTPAPSESPTDAPIDLPTSGSSKRTKSPKGSAKETKKKGIKKTKKKGSAEETKTNKGSESKKKSGKKRE